MGEEDCGAMWWSAKRMRRSVGERVGCCGLAGVVGKFETRDEMPKGCWVERGKGDWWRDVLKWAA